MGIPVKVAPKNQIVIHQNIRQKIGLHPQDEVIFAYDSWAGLLHMDLKMSRFFLLIISNSYIFTYKAKRIPNSIGGVPIFPWMSCGGRRMIERGKHQNWSNFNSASLTPIVLTCNKCQEERPDPSVC